LKSYATLAASILFRDVIGDFEMPQAEWGVCLDRCILCGQCRDAHLRCEQVRCTEEKFISIS